MKKHLAILLAASVSTIAGISSAHAQSLGQIRSADGDVLEVQRSGGGGNGPVTVCLRTYPGMWKKDINITGVGRLASEQGTEDCMQISPGFIRFQMVKAKALGVMTGVGYGSLDLSNAGGSRVTISWIRD